jgi:phage I-like protein
MRKQKLGRYVQTYLEAMPLPHQLGMAGDEDDSPKTTRIQIMPWGFQRLADAELREMFGEPGTILVDEESARVIPAEFALRPLDYHVNLDHGRPDGRAVGWIHDVEVVEGQGVFLDVEWTDEGRQLVTSQSYRYTSAEPIIDMREGRIVAIVGLALTNNPALQGMSPVELSHLRSQYLIENAGDIPENGDEEMNWWEKLKAFFTRHPEDEGDAIMQVAEMSRAAGKLAALEKEHAELTEQLATAKEFGEKLIDELKEVRAEMAEREAKAAEVEAAAKKTEAEAEVKAALAAGQLSPAMEEWAVEQALNHHDAFAAFLSTVKEGTFSAPEESVETPPTRKGVVPSSGDAREVEATKIAEFRRSENAKRHAEGHPPLSASEAFVEYHRMNRAMLAGKE